MKYDDIIREITAAACPDGMRTKLVAIDGLGGAGKSTLAATLMAHLENVTVVHTDDFASPDNTLDWWPRMVKQVLAPLSENKPARYQRYDWDAGSLAEWRTVEPGGILLLEGVSASRKKFRPYLAYSIWVETPRDERLRRGLQRDGQDALEQWQKWMRAEDEYAAQELPQKHADIVVAGISS